MHRPEHRNYIRADKAMGGGRAVHEFVQTCLPAGDNILKQPGADEDVVLQPRVLDGRDGDGAAAAR
ncbi:hypothetical protein [Streptomyces sp. NPDC002402]